MSNAPHSCDVSRRLAAIEAFFTEQLCKDGRITAVGVTVTVLESAEGRPHAVALGEREGS
jgi:hypothetical protein